MHDRSVAKKGGEGADDGRTVTESVVIAVSEATGTSPMELPPLATVIDPDALESLVSGAADRPHESSMTARFAYTGHVVIVDASGEIAVEELPGE